MSSSSLVSRVRGWLWRAGPWAAPAAAAALGAALWVGSPPAHAAPLGGDAPAPIERVAFVARNDLPFDSLAVGPVAAMVGGPILITSPQPPLSPAAARALADFDPDQVIIAGGTAAISDQVEAEIEAACGCPASRAAGVGRDQTAQEVARLLDTLGIGRTVVTTGAGPGAQIVGDAYLGGTLHTDTVTADGVDLGAEVATLGAEVATLRAEVDALTTLLEGVHRDTGAVGVETIVFDGVNLQVVSGAGATDAAVNGRGNLIVGYNEFPDPCDLPCDAAQARVGSHNLVVGRGHSYSSYGGIVVGDANQIRAPYATVTGGRRNVASGAYASVSGGYSNSASGDSASVSGGYFNTASGDGASVSGGSGDTVADACDWRVGDLLEPELC